MLNGLLSKREAAEILGISVYSIQRLLHDIGVVRVGRRRILIHPDDLRSYIEGRRQKPRQARRAFDASPE